MTVIELPDEQAAALKARAAREGLTLEDWFRKWAEEQPPAMQPLQTAADIVLGRMRNVPPDIMAAMPKDGASQHDHYIYGWPKREA
jgi:plasmid stability protein